MDQNSVRKLLKPDGKKVIYFYMEGCPYCEKTNPQWEYVKNKNYPYKFYKIESSNIPDELKNKISGFPQFHIIENGSTRVIEGSKDSNEELDKALKLNSGKANGGRRRTRRLRGTIRKRLRRVNSRNVRF